MLKTTKELVEQTNPNLITLTGDQCYGQRNVLEAICKQMESFQIPWAPVFGNHDCEQRDVTLQEQSEIYRNYKHCFFMDGPIDLSIVKENNSPAIGNYVINIVKVNGESFQVIRSLIFMNTGSIQDYYENSYPLKRRYWKRNYACLNKNQLQWYQAMASSVQKYSKTPVPSSLVFHIPIFAFVDAVAEAFNTDVDVYDVDAWLEETKKISFSDSFSADNWKEGYKNSFGVMHEPICGAPYDDGVFAVIKMVGTTDLVYVGHEHTNNFNIEYQNVNLIYAMKTGIGSYYEKDMIGGTLITIKADGSATVEHILNTP